jgi:hypothetical protein
VGSGREQHGCANEGIRFGVGSGGGDRDDDSPKKNFRATTKSHAAMTITMPAIGPELREGGDVSSGLGLACSAASTAMLWQSRAGKVGLTVVCSGQPEGRSKREAVAGSILSK